MIKVEACIKEHCPELGKVCLGKDEEKEWRVEGVGEVHSTLQHQHRWKSFVFLQGGLVHIPFKQACCRALNAPQDPIDDVTGTLGGINWSMP